MSVVSHGKLQTSSFLGDWCKGTVVGLLGEGAIVGLWLKHQHKTLEGSQEFVRSFAQEHKVATHMIVGALALAPVVSSALRATAKQISQLKGHIEVLEQKVPASHPDSSKIVDDRLYVVEQLLVDFRSELESFRTNVDSRLTQLEQAVQTQPRILPAQLQELSGKHNTLEERVNAHHTSLMREVRKLEEKCATILQQLEGSHEQPSTVLEVPLSGGKGPSKVNLRGK